jgi:hypothetical protein
MLPRQFTTMSTFSSAALFVLAGLVACGGGTSDDEDEADAAPASTDITGQYDNVALESGPCGATTPSTLAPPFLLVDSLQTTYYVRSCQTLEDTDCPSIYYDFNTPIENGWAAEGGSSFFSGECTLSWERSNATRIDGVLNVHTLRYQAIGTVPEVDCNLAAAEALTTCSSESLLTATVVTGS